MTGRSTIQPTYSGALYGPSFDRSLGTAGISAISADFAAASVSASLLPTGSLFSLQFQASALINSNYLWANSFAMIIEGLYYTGPTNKSFIFAGGFSGICNSPNSEDGLTAQIYFFRGTNFIYTTLLTDLIYERHAQVITNFSLRITCTNNGAALSNTISVPMAPGETVYLHATLSVLVHGAGVNGQSTSPLQVFCLNPEGLVSESMRTDVPLSLSKSFNQVRIRWPATRRQCIPEWTPALQSPQWEPLTNAVVSDTSGNLLVVPLSQNAGFFRTRVP